MADNVRQNHYKSREFYEKQMCSLAVNFMEVAIKMQTQDFCFLQHRPIFFQEKDVY